MKVILRDVSGSLSGSAWWIDDAKLLQHAELIEVLLDAPSLA
jgi:hypothetical protein